MSKRKVETLDISTYGKNPIEKRLRRGSEEACRYCSPFARRLAFFTVTMKFYFAAFALSITWLGVTEVKAGRECGIKPSAVERLESQVCDSLVGCPHIINITCFSEEERWQHCSTVCDGNHEYACQTFCPEYECRDDEDEISTTTETATTSTASSGTIAPEESCTCTDLKDRVDSQAQIIQSLSKDLNKMETKVLAELQKGIVDEVKIPVAFLVAATVSLWALVILGSIIMMCVLWAKPSWLRRLVQVRNGDSTELEQQNNGGEIDDIRSRTEFLFAALKKHIGVEDDADSLAQQVLTLSKDIDNVKTEVLRELKRGPNDGPVVNLRRINSSEQDQ